MTFSVSADWILPIATSPIRQGSVTIDDGRIAAVEQDVRGGAVALGRVAILPALVNAHTHLELSHLHGQVPPGASFTGWIRGIMALRRQFPDAADPRIVDAARAAIASARASGTGLFGDVANTLVTVPLLREAGVAARVFYEQLGFNAGDPVERVRQARERVDAAGASDAVRVALAPHAPYSVSPALFRAIRADLDARPTDVSSVHLGESADEVELLRRGSGAMRRTLEDLGVWTDAWQVPGTSPVDYLTDLGFLDRRTLVVHGVQFGADELHRLRALGATLVSCPRSNRHVGVGSPPLAAFYDSGVDVALGTDSLASADDLDMFAELAEARRIAPGVPAASLLRSATLTGARGLGFGAEVGSVEVGKRASLVAVRVPAAVGDVEEYLVSGAIGPGDVSWLEPPS